MNTRQRINRRLAAFLATLALTVVATIALAQSATIKNVDNYAGYSNVYTDRPNTTIKVTELDADKKPIRSWTGTTDLDGKLTIPAGHVLSKDYLRAELSSSDKSPGFIVPNSIQGGEGFTFAAAGSVEGEVVSIQTVEGEVVSSSKTDRLGRVFLPAGLAAGSYFLVRGTTDAIVRTLDVGPEAELATPSPIGCRPLATANLREPLSLKGWGFSPNAADMSVGLTGGSGGNLPVLAATSGELITASPLGAGLKPGAASLTVANLQSGAKTAASPVVLYDIQGKLTQRTVTSGTQTHLVITVEPRNLLGTVEAQVLSGPVQFRGGALRATAAVSNGSADIPVFSRPGSAGKFNLSWSLVNVVLPTIVHNWDDFDVKRDKDGIDGSETVTLSEKPSGRLVQQIKWDKYGKILWIIDWEYDARGRMRKKTTQTNHADGGWTINTQEWDASGKLTSDTSKSFDKDGKEK